MPLANPIALSVSAGQAPPVPAADAKPAATTAGNYFVANYPPFSFWTAEHAPAAVAALGQPGDAATPLGLYIHIPFCRKRCHFCYFRVYTDKNAEQIRGYLDATATELRLALRGGFANGRRPTFVYVGGGTPSYLSSEQLAELFGSLQQHLPFDQAQEVAFEAEPGTLNEKKVHAIRALGVTRLSLGVEHFDDGVLQSNGRAHLSKQVYQAYQWCQDAGFAQLNVDLIAGMLNETPELWRRTVEETIRLQPDSVTIYQMEIPFNTTIYKQMVADGKVEAPVADWPTKRRWVAEAFSALEAAGYTVTSATTAVRHPARTQFLYRDLLWQGADLLSLGVASFGHVSGVHYQNEHHWDAYLARLSQGELPILRALPTTAQERLIRELSLQLKLGRVRVGPFQRKFGVDVLERFAEPLADLRQRGLLAQSPGDEVVLTREALLLVDTLLPAFFLEQHRGARYA